MATKPQAKKKTPSRSTHAPAPTKLLPVTLLRVDLIDPSPINRDATRDLSGLVESVRTYGIQQPIKVRPKGDRYEIVYGERRWQAAKKLGLSEIPVLIEELTDDEAHARRVLENTQRADPHALEEAEAYERLLAMKDDKGAAVHTPETIALVAGRSVGHIYNRLRLTALAPVFRKLFYAGEVSTSVAFLIARHIPTHLHDEAAAKLKEFVEEADEFGGYIDDGGHLTVLGIKEFIEAEYDARLDTAPFSMKDAKLLPAAGSCAACPKRSGNQPQLFDFADKTASKDRCGDIECYQAKLDAHVEQQKQKVLSVGGRVVSPEESKKVFHGGSSLPWNSPWIDLDATCYDAPDQPTWRKLLGDHCPPPVLAFTSQHRPTLIADKKAVLDILTKAGRDPASLKAKAEAARLAKQKPSTKKAVDPRDADLDEDGEEADPDDDDAAFDSEQERIRQLPPDHPESLARTGVTDPNEARHQTAISHLARQRAMAAIIAAADKAPADDHRFIQVIVDSMLNGGYHDAVLATVKRRIPTRPKGEHAGVTLASHRLGLTPHQLRALALELVLARDGYFVHNADVYARQMTAAIALYGIDGAALHAEAKRELDEKRDGRRKLKSSIG